MTIKVLSLIFAFALTIGSLTVLPNNIFAGTCITSVSNNATLNITSSPSSDLEPGDTFVLYIYDEAPGQPLPPPVFEGRGTITDQGRLPSIDVSWLVQSDQTTYYYTLERTNFRLPFFNCTSSFRLSGTGGVGADNPCNVDEGYCATAIGNFPIDTAEFATRFLQIATGLAGGIALILMVIGSIRVLTSSGDQQKLSGGRDMIVAAIAGLLFLIFSVLILRFIGISIIGF